MMDFLRRLAADPIAAYAAGLSTMLAAVRVLEWLQDRPRVVVQIGTSFLPSDGRPAIAFGAHNFGSRSTTLTQFFYLVPLDRLLPDLARGLRQKFAIESPLLRSSICEVVPPFPARLDPGGIVTVRWAMDHFNQSGLSWPLALVGFRDARGRAHYCVGGIRGWWLRWRARHGR